MTPPTPPTPTGVTSLNGLSGVLTLAAGAGITITPAGLTLTIDATGSSGITALTGDATASGTGSVPLTLATVNSNVGSFGSASSVSTLTVNAKGLITAASSTSIQITESQVTNLVSDLAGKQATGNYLTALTGDATASGPGSAALTLAIVNSNVGSFGSTSNVSTITVNAKGLITAASDTAIQITESQVTNLTTDLSNKANTSTTISTTAPLSGGGDLSANRTLSISQSTTSTDGYLSSTDWNTFNNKQPAGNYITALTGDATASGPGSAALTLATVNSNVGSFGTASNVSTVTVNAKGLITAAADTAIQITESQVTNLVSDLAGKQATGNYITALTGDATASGPGSAALTLATVNSNVGSFGSATQVGIFTVNAKGLITAASDIAIAIPFSQVSGAVPINQGGTGQTTANAGFNALSPMTTGGDLIYGGASGVGTRLANGTVGQFLTSNGGTTAPTWTTVATPTSAGPSTLRTLTTIDEDWVTGALAGSLGWTATVAGSGTVAMNTADLSTTHWGVVQLTSGTASASAALLSLNTLARPLVFGTANNTYSEFYISLSALSTGSNDYIVRIGFFDNWTGLPNNGVWFDYLSGTSVNWRMSTANGGSRTQTASSTAVATGWLKLSIKTTGASAEYFVNDSSLGTVSTNFPTAAIWPGVGITKTANGTTNTTLLIDWFSLYASWGSSR